MPRSKERKQKEAWVIVKYNEGMFWAKIKTKDSWTGLTKHWRTHNKEGQNGGWKKRNIQWIDSHKERAGRVRIIFITSRKVKLEVRK